VLIRKLAFALVITAVGLPCSARTILKFEPLVLAPYEIAYVQESSCPAGKVLKVTGAIRGLDRKKVCVELATVQSSLAATAVPQGRPPVGAGAVHLGDVIDREAARY
jgi:hypothetical protein